jgi:ABC-2 type transport system ATP-binding protein
MQQKVQFIATVLHNPQFLILDEPFSGLDPINSQLLKNEILELKNQGTTILFSTHRMEQVEEMCEKIVLINKGNLLIQGNVKDIKNTYKKNLFTIQYQSIDEAQEWQPHNPPQNIQIVYSSTNTCTFKITEANNINEALAYFSQQPILISKFEEVIPSLEEIFIQKVNSAQ